MQPRVYYTLFMLLALAVFIAVRWLQPKSAPVAALPWRYRLALGWAVLVGGAFGAKIGYTLASGGDWLESGTWLTDGKTVTTGLIGAYLAVELTKAVLHIHVKTGDSYALPLALALAVGRWGCFFNGCCGGLPTDLPWGVAFGDGVRRHPTQIYESIFHLMMAGVLLIIMWRGAFHLQRLKLYLIAYGVFRFCSEWLRPEPIWAAGLTFYQWVCLFMVVGLSVQWWYDRRWAAEPQPAQTTIAAEEPLVIS
jgi:prolipoprotein diacylglyceryltransferase